MQAPAPVAVEAKSLSLLTALASNPPAYPRNPTHVRHEPLVLYIARVPGSRDVFLTPMKPREKVVTAEDIQTSLYFVHFDQPEDANLIAEPEFREPNYSEQRPPPTNYASAPAVPRKAVPGAPASQRNNGSPVRKPVPGTLAPVTNVENRQNINAGNYHQPPSMLGPDYTPRRSFDSDARRQENDRPAFPPRRSYDPSRLVGTSLTLIRRDPASGAQWNVARIEDPPVLEVSSSNFNDSSSKRKVGAPMYIEVTNPGYSKFLHADQERVSSQPPESARNPPQNTFRRRLWMEGAQNSNGGFGHRKNSSVDYSGRPSSRGYQDSRADMRASDPRTGPPPSFLTRDDQEYGTIQVSERQSNFRGYVFSSPWNGRCEFLTGGGGGSLKCRHVVPGLQGAPPAAAVVSELRFNLPGSSMPATPRGEEKSKRSSFFHRGRHSRNNSSFSVDKDDTSDVRNSLDRLDLSLGQEYAGGGFGGKQAKLGKIILEDEGLKMMDLLVAANLGLWWRAYERANGSRGDRGSIS